MPWSCSASVLPATSEGMLLVLSLGWVLPAAGRRSTGASGTCCRLVNSCLVLRISEKCESFQKGSLAAYSDLDPQADGEMLCNLKPAT